jgi:hypothetical protein
MNTITFNNGLTTESFTEASLNDMSGPALVELYNDVVRNFSNGDSVPSVRRFADKSTAVARTWKLLQRYAEAHPEVEAEEPEQAEPKEVAPVNETETKAPVAAPKAKKAPKAPAEKKPRQPRGTNLAAPGHAPIPCREGSKQALLLDMLARPMGVTMEQLIEALSGGNKPWTEATVRSGFGWDMKLKGYGVCSSFDAEGREWFHIVIPDGHAIPAHKPLKGKAKADARQASLEV